MGNCGPTNSKKTSIINTHNAWAQIKKHYSVSKKILGTGSYAKVYEGRSFANPDYLVAIKSINKPDLGADDLK